MPADEILKRYSVHEVYQIMANPPKRSHGVLTAKQVSDRVKISSVMVARAQKHGKELGKRERLWLWDKERAAACLGHDVLACQCSMDDYLWFYWRLAQDRGKVLGPRLIERIQEIKSVFAQFFCKEVSGTRQESACLFDVVETPPDGSLEIEKWEMVFDYLRQKLEAEMS